MVARISLAAMALCILPGASGQEVSWAEKVEMGRSFLAGNLIVAPNHFREDRLEELAKKLLKQYLDRGALSLSIFPSDNYPPPNIGKADHWHNYDLLLNWYPEARNWEECRLTAIGGDAVLELRHGMGRINRRVLAGVDPLRRRVGGWGVKILDIAPQSPFGPPPREIDKYPIGSRTAKIAVYAYAEGGLSEDTARQLTKQMFDVLPVNKLQVTLSDSPWFIDDPEYPAQWPFLEDVAFPSRREYAATITFVCSMQDQKPSCNRRNPE